MKSANQLRWILDPEKTYSFSSPLIISLFIMYLHLEAIIVLLKYKFKRFKPSGLTDIGIKNAPDHFFRPKNVTILVLTR